jgi:acyl-CoA synthetase (NDP forming)
MALKDLEKEASLNKSNLSCFFEPESIAVIGSLREGYFGGYVVVKTLRNGGFAGKIYPVHPTYKEVLGLRVYPSIKDIQEKIDLALIIINRQAVPNVMRECAEKGIKAVIVVADGFAERDEEGAKLQNEILEIARKVGMRIIGPNTVGVANPEKGLITSPYEAGYDRITPGGIAICSQTGITHSQAFPFSDLNYGVSKICDFGNKCDLDECDMLEYLKEDPSTKVITMYLESMRDGRKFLEISKRVTPEKPVLVLKSGRTKEGARVSASHTGSLAMDDQVFDAACKQAGILRLERFSELFELPKMFALQPLPKGNRLGITTITGGAGVLATDEAAKFGLSIPTLSPETVEKLNSIFPNLGKPIMDIGPAMAAISDFVAFLPEVMETILSDDHIDCLLNIIWAGPVEGWGESHVKVYKELLRNFQKPIATWIYGPRVPIIHDLTHRIEDLGFPVFVEVEMAVKALGIAYQYSIWKKKGET